MLLTSTQASLALYVVELSIARKKTPHTVGEQVDKSAAIDTLRLIGSDGWAWKLHFVSLSNNTVKSRIANLSLNTTKQVVTRKKKAANWSYQLGESTKTGKDAQLMVFARYKSGMDLEEEFLLCKPLVKTATGADIFNVVDNFNKKKALGEKTASASVLTALPRCLVLDRGSLRKSNKCSDLVPKHYTLY